MKSFWLPVLKSVAHAWRGLRVAFRSERNFRLQTAIALMLIAGMLVLPLALIERVILLLAIALVLVLELLNSAVERIVDLLKPRLNEYAGDIKDLMAGAVMVASAFAALTGVLVLWPYLNLFLQRL